MVPFSTLKICGSLVEAPAPEKAAQLGDPLIVYGGLLRLRLGCRLVTHGPELVDIENLVIEAQAFLAKENWPRAVKLDCKGNHSEERKGRQEDERGQGRSLPKSSVRHPTPTSAFPPPGGWEAY